MTEIVTIAGIRNMRLMQKKGMPLPDGWQSLIIDYIKRKESVLDILYPNKHSYMYRQSNESLKEARRIAKLMGVTHG